MKPGSSIRRPAVAGLFYPGDPERLADSVDALLQGVPEPPAADPVGMLVSPHAGYRFSGSTAAHAFRRLARGTIDTVVVVGPSHVEAFDFTSVYDGEAYETPLGMIPVATDLARALEEPPSIRRSPRGHVVARGGRGEHGIEVILPFLQRTLGEFTLVPVVMGSQSWEACEALGAALARHSRPESTLLVASSDLSHFYRYEEAVRLDHAFCDLLESLDARALHAGVVAGTCEACGAGPVTATLIATDSLPAREARVLAHCNSGDVTGERDSVVGYASAVVTSPGEAS